ncbi:MAG TPA: PKD domain-containing protein [Thermoanaerobaculia bacterium]|nr:PKD domain-containing protein [Thermoanaerobaculia bacterium]
MLTSSRPAGASPSARRLLTGLLPALVGVLLTAGPARPAAAQCSLVTGPTVFTCPDLGNDGCWGNLRLRPNTISRTYTKGEGGPDRISVPLNHGHAIYSLANPGAPAYVAVGDIRNPPPGGVGPITGDGQNFVVGAAGVSSDGQRGLISMQITGYGSTIVGKPSPDAFNASGNTGGPQSTNLLVQKKGSRYIGYGLIGKVLWAADVTTTPASYQETPPMPWESQSDWANQGLLANPAWLQLAEGNGYQYLYWQNGKNVVLVDASNPGASGGVVNGPPAITAGYATWSIPFATWGRPTSDNFQYVSVSVDPRSAGGDVYVLGSFLTSGVPSFSLLKWNRSDPGNPTLVGTFNPDAAFNQSGGTRPGRAAFNSYSNDVDIFMWATSPAATANGPKGTLRLYATSARVFGAAISQTVDLDMNLAPTPQSISDWALLRKSDKDVYAYVTDSASVYALHLTCQAGPAPASGHLAVTNTSASQTLASGDTVFIGDTLRITPSISPPNSVEAIENWNLDVNYHAGSEHGSIGFFQLQSPDYCLTGCAATGVPYPGAVDPPQFTMVGPCDPKSPWSGTPSSGVGCWASVVANGDFPASPAAGATRVQTFGFEAKNVDPGTTSPVPLATFGVTWKVPTTKVQNLAALLDVNNKATFTSGSDGHPISSGFKWYFGTNPSAPPTDPTIAQDLSCTSANCQHQFSAGKGTYNAWLTATYPGGFSTPDCVSCTAGAFVVTVTDFVASFTAPSVGYIGGSPLNVTNQSQKDPSITATYSYLLCDASLTACQNGTGSYTGLTGNGPWNITVPSPAGTWWLRIRATYSPGPYSDWLPNVVSDPTAWPITVSNAPPAVTLSVSPNPADVNSSVSFSATASNFPGTLTSASYAWNFGDGGTATGPSASHTYTASGTFTSRCTVTDSLSNVASAIRVVTVNGAPPPPTPLSVSVSASPSSTTPNTAVTFTATASGGSGSYTIYTWNFGDGSPLVPGPYNSTSHPYAAAGTYYPSCTVRDSDGNSASSSAIVTVTTGSGPGCPVTGINVYSGGFLVGSSPSTISVNVGTAVQFFPQPGSGGSSFSWNFGDGTSDTVRNPVKTYPTPGTYTAQVTVDGTCTVSVTMNITGVSVTPDFRIAYPSGADAAPGTDGSFLVAGGQPVTFRAVNAANPTQNISVTNPYWNFGDGTTSGVNPTPKTYPFIPPWGSTYTAQLTVPGQPTVSHTVYVVSGIPTAAYAFAYSINGQPGAAVDPNKVTPGAGIYFPSTGPPGAEYYWDFGDGTPCTPSTPTSDLCRLPTTAHAFAKTGTYTVVLRVKLGGNTFQTSSPTTFVVSETPRWIVPGLVYRTGPTAGSYYVTDVVIQNPSTTNWATYSIALLDGQEPVWRKLSDFQPNESRPMKNILSSVFGKPLDGPTYALMVRGDAVPPNAEPVIRGFTYNDGGTPSKGTYGDAIPAVPASLAVAQDSAGADREFPGLRDMPVSKAAPPDVAAAYSGIGFANITNVPATVYVNLYSRLLAGPVAHGGTVPLTVGAYQTVEVPRILKQALSVTGTPWENYDVSNYWMVFDVSGAGAKLIPYATITDVASTDVTYLTSVPNVAGNIRIPNFVRNNIGGDRIRTRLNVFNTSAVTRKVRFTLSFRYCPGGGACWPRADMTLTPDVQSGYSIYSDDIIQWWYANLGTPISDSDSFVDTYLDVQPADANTDPLITRTETYNATTGGSFGTHVPGLTVTNHGAGAGSGRTRLQIPYLLPSGNGWGYVTKVTLVSLDNSVAPQVRLRLREPFPGSGMTPAPEKVVTVDGRILEQPLEAYFPEVTNTPMFPGWYSLEIDALSGTLAAYAVIGDNASGDGKLIVAQPLP